MEIVFPISEFMLDERLPVDKVMPIFLEDDMISQRMNIGW